MGMDKTGCARRQFSRSTDAGERDRGESGGRSGSGVEVETSRDGMRTKQVANSKLLTIIKANIRGI